MSASTDSTIKLWNIGASASGAADQGTQQVAKQGPAMSYTGHVNEKHFVGLSVTSDGYIACGSERSRAYCYYRSFPKPVASHRLDPRADAWAAPPASHQPEEEEDPQATSAFVSSVCWSQKNHVLLAASSIGGIEVIQLA